MTELNELFTEARKLDRVGKVMTSLVQPSAWRQNFTEEDSLLCALDRIFDDALIFNFNGETHRGLKKEVISLTTKRAKAVALTEQPENNQ